MGNWRIEPLNKQHQRDGFSSGKPQLDDFIRFRVSQYEKRNLGKTFVAVSTSIPTRNGGSNEMVAGYYTLAASAIEFQHLPPKSTKKLPRHPVPVVLLARLAVDQSCQGQGLGVALLMDALTRSLRLASELVIHAIAVDAIDQQAVSFYEKFGFAPMVDKTSRLFLPISTLANVLGKTN